jgi:hypothetical protein
MSETSLRRGEHRTSLSAIGNEYETNVTLVEVSVHVEGTVKSCQMRYELLRLVLHTEYAGVRHQQGSSTAYSLL